MPKKNQQQNILIQIREDTTDQDGHYWGTTDDQKWVDWKNKIRHSTRRLKTIGDVKRSLEKRLHIPMRDAIVWDSIGNIQRNTRLLKDLSKNVEYLVVEVGKITAYEYHFPIVGRQVIYEPTDYNDLPADFSTTTTETEEEVYEIEWQ